MKKSNLTINVTGTTYEGRQGRLWHLRKNEKQAYVTLYRDKNNQHDKNAIKIIAHVKGSKPFDVGFVPAVQAKELAPVIDAGNTKVYIKGFTTSVYTAQNKRTICCRVNIKLYPTPAA